MNTRALLLLTVLISGLLLAVTVAMNRVVDRYDQLVADFSDNDHIVLNIQNAVEESDINHLHDQTARLYTLHTRLIAALYSLVGMIRASGRVLYMIAGLNVGIVILNIAISHRRSMNKKAQPENGGDA